MTYFIVLTNLKHHLCIISGQFHLLNTIFISCYLTNIQLKTYKRSTNYKKCIST